jgi:hypothetical protein
MTYAGKGTREPMQYELLRTLPTHTSTSCLHNIYHLGTKSHSHISINIDPSVTKNYIGLIISNIPLMSGRRLSHCSLDFMINQSIQRRIWLNTDAIVMVFGVTSVEIIVSTK